jgi:hypothetical protein
MEDFQSLKPVEDIGQSIAARQLSGQNISVSLEIDEENALSDD